MKESKSQVSQAMNTNAARRAQLDTVQARLILSTLESLFREHSQAVEKMRTRCSRVQQEARIFISRELVCLSSSAAALAQTLMAGGATPEHLKKLIFTDRQALEKNIYPKLNLKEADDLELLKELDFERAAVDVLREAIRLQKSRINTLRTEEIAALNRSRADEHTKLARAVLAAVDGLNSNPLVEQDRKLAEELGAEIELLKPGPFPRRILSTELLRWLNECVSGGLIDAGEISKG